MRSYRGRSTCDSKSRCISHLTTLYYFLQGKTRYVPRRAQASSFICTRSQLRTSQDSWEIVVWSLCRFRPHFPFYCHLIYYTHCYFCKSPGHSQTSKMHCFWHCSIFSRHSKTRWIDWEHPFLTILPFYFSGDAVAMSKVHFCSWAYIFQTQPNTARSRPFLPVGSPEKLIVELYVQFCAFCKYLCSVALHIHGERYKCNIGLSGWSSPWPIWPKGIAFCDSSVPPCLLNAQAALLTH